MLLFLFCVSTIVFFDSKILTLNDHPGNWKKIESSLYNLKGSKIKNKTSILLKIIGNS